MIESLITEERLVKWAEDIIHNTIKQDEETDIIISDWINDIIQKNDYHEIEKNDKKNVISYIIQ